MEGRRQYFDIVVGAACRPPSGVGRTTARSLASKRCAGRVAFYASRVDAAWVAGERVRPQPGGFYGGWVTSEIVGPFKGEPDCRPYEYGRASGDRDNRTRLDGAIGAHHAIRGPSASRAPVYSVKAASRPRCEPDPRRHRHPCRPPPAPPCRAGRLLSGGRTMIEQAPVRDATESRLRRAYGFEEVALVPGAVTADPAEVDLSTDLGGFRLQIPFLAAAMDAVADADFAATRAARRDRLRQPRGAIHPVRGRDADYRAGCCRRVRPGRRPRPGPGLRTAGPRRADQRGHHPNQGAGRERGGRDHSRIGLASRGASRRGRGGPLPRPVPGQQRSSPLDLDPGPLPCRSHRRAEAPGPGRQHRQRRGRVQLITGRGRNLRRGRAGCGLHDP